MLVSGVCKEQQLKSDEFRAWVAETGQPFGLHRKCWEFAFISQSLYERGMLRPGRRGLGFGVGREPLVAMFAKRGCSVVATDQASEAAERTGWARTNQHSTTVDALNERAICDPESFRRLVSFRAVDMNAIPDDLRDFDFTWSSCSFEHLGSIEKGMRFLERQMECLKPGGVAVHTTEFNLSSNEETIDNTGCVLFRRRDLEEMARRLRERGHQIELDLTLGDRVADNYVDVPPYENQYHLRLQLDRFVTTSVGLIVEKNRSRRSRLSLFGWRRHLRGSLVAADRT